LAFTQVSRPGVPSIVEVCCHFWPAGGTMRMPYLPGAMPLTSTSPSAMPYGLRAGSAASSAVIVCSVPSPSRTTLPSAS